MQDGVNDFQRGASGLGLNVDGNAAPVVRDGDGIAFVDLHKDVGTESGEGLIDAVVHDFINKMVQSAGGRGADIHSGAFADGFKPLKDLDFGSVVSGRGLVEFHGRFPFSEPLVFDASLYHRIPKNESEN